MGNSRPSRVFLFPLPETVFYPKTRLPLHIFEPRYRAMTAAALEGEGLIGMVLLKPGWEENYYNSPATVSVGCAGQIDQSEKLEDGKYNILLQGESRFQIIREIPGKSYRQADVEFLEEINDQTISDKASCPEHTELVKLYSRYLELLPEKNKERRHLDLNRCASLSEAVNQTAYLFDLKPGEKQSFLEQRDVLKRQRYVREFLQFQIELARISKEKLDAGFDVRSN